ncbi:hypothetical protein [Teredinibacter sp. KSP-S5-2]|uniref:hypothetical protein n=1 Tax=Teredinibacter sp. KSP-S5-2 TaxID=3034506 RepID=UPI0029352C66|nr:hypothetical protein [Teredinibacter sp. KSP-S5-2]WNO10313.1 hypothetical protein P5V12_03915 [Teredinibacter sp. KSP-S5-2]
MRKLLLLIILLCSSGSYGAGNVEVTVTDVGIKWGKACALLSNGDNIFMDLATETGRAEYSTVLTAFAGGRSLLVYITDNTIPSICNAAFVKQHGMIVLIK